VNAGQKSGRLSDLVSRFSRPNKTLATFLSLGFSQRAAEVMDPGPVIGPNITFLGERALLDERVDAVLCWDVFDDLGAR